MQHSRQTLTPLAQTMISNNGMFLMHKSVAAQAAHEAFDTRHSAHVQQVGYLQFRAWKKWLALSCR